MVQGLDDSHSGLETVASIVVTLRCSLNSIIAVETALRLRSAPPYDVPAMPVTGTISEGGQETPEPLADTDLGSIQPASWQEFFDRVQSVHLPQRGGAFRSLTYAVYSALLLANFSAVYSAN